MIAPLDQLLVDPVTDLLINGPNEVWIVDASGFRLVEMQFQDDEEVRALAVRIATLVGRPLDDAHPFVDLEYEGVRVHAILPPLVKATHISIRRLSHQFTSLTDLLGPCDATEDLREIVKSRKNFLISGGTGSGKTTLLSALLGEVEPLSRIAVIEDTREVAANHPHLVSMQSRLANSEGRGEISLRDLVRQSLRMRPDRIFVGEVRGAEVIDLLAALNTGHAGSGGTVHANSALEVPSRMETMALFAGVPADAARRLFFSAIELIVHLRPAPHRGVESLVFAVEGELLPLAMYDFAGNRG